MARWLRQWIGDADGGSLRARLEHLGPVPPDGLRRIQVTAINAVEASMIRNHPRALAQMATGSGKTFMAANLAYRLVRFGDAERVLFLVDRANLGRQTLREFQQAAALRRSVLKAAFEGKLVEQDPSDEPASVLLERIRVERAPTST
jgi:superfamily II DNA or RNA helicase